MSKSSLDNKTSTVSSNDIEFDKKRLNVSNNSNRVDINILKSKLRATEAKEFKKNIFIFSFLILVLGILGIYLTF